MSPAGVTAHGSRSPGQSRASQSRRPLRCPCWWNVTGRGGGVIPRRCSPRHARSQSHQQARSLWEPRGRGHATSCPQGAGVLRPAGALCCRSPLREPLPRATCSPAVQLGHPSTPTPRTGLLPRFCLSSVYQPLYPPLFSSPSLGARRTSIGRAEFGQRDHVFPQDTGSMWGTDC